MFYDMNLICGGKHYIYNNIIQISDLERFWHIRFLANRAYDSAFFLRLVIFWKGDKHMLRHLVALLVMFAAIMFGLELLAGPSIPVDVLLGRMYWLPITFPNALPDLSNPIISLLPVFPLLPFMFLLTAGLLSLFEMD
jgi:hypothetical protein